MRALGTSPWNSLTVFQRVTEMSLRRLCLLPCLLPLILAGTMAQASQQVPPPQAPKQIPLPSDLPAAAGVYWKQDGGQWIKLEPSVLADTKNRGMGRFLETDGLSNLKTTVVFRGAQASVRILDRRPVFHVRETGSAAHALIVRLKRKKENREAEVSSWEAGIRNQQGFNRGQIHQVVTSQPARGYYTITPVSDLEEGEYLLVLGDVDGGFDFAIGQTRR